jgi:hypothetical protein
MQLKWQSDGLAKFGYKQDIKGKNSFKKKSEIWRFLKKRNYFSGI